MKRGWILFLSLALVLFTLTPCAWAATIAELGFENSAAGDTSYPGNGEIGWEFENPAGLLSAVFTPTSNPLGGNNVFRIVGDGAVGDDASVVWIETVPVDVSCFRNVGLQLRWVSAATIDFDEHDQLLFSIVWDKPPGLDSDGAVIVGNAGLNQTTPQTVNLGGPGVIPDSVTNVWVVVIYSSLNPSSSKIIYIDDILIEGDDITPPRPVGTIAVNSGTPMPLDAFETCDGDAVTITATNWENYNVSWFFDPDGGFTEQIEPSAPPNEHSFTANTTGVWDIHYTYNGKNCTYEYSFPITVNPLPECSINTSGSPVAASSAANWASVDGEVECSWAVGGAAANVQGNTTCNVSWDASYTGDGMTSQYAMLNVTITDNNTCMNECEVQVEVVPPIDADPGIETAEDDTGRTCIAMNVTGGFNRTVNWTPDVFKFDNATGLWCGNLPPCQTSSVKVEITDAVGSTPFEKMLRVSFNCPVPTLNEWGLIIFGLLLAGTAAWFIRGRKRMS